MSGIDGTRVRETTIAILAGGQRPQSTTELREQLHHVHASSSQRVSVQIYRCLRILVDSGRVSRSHTDKGRTYWALSPTEAARAPITDRT